MSASLPGPGAGPGAGPPVCPRHPDRVAYVRCQRCERPTCPECQRPAPVGIHCVDCVRDANRVARAPRTAFGAPLRGGRPVVTVTLIVLNVVSFGLQQVLGGSGTTSWTSALAFSPAYGEIEPWRFMTTAFLHSTGSIFHIGFNMYALWVLGQSLEPALGRARFAVLYLLSALGGTVMVLLFASPVEVDWVRAVVGASGAVFGLFGAILVVLRRLGRSAQPIVVLLVINGVLGFVVPNISWQGHLGGLLTGLALGAAFAYAPRERRRTVAIAASVGVLVVLIVLALVKYASVTAAFG